MEQPIHGVGAEARRAALWTGRRAGDYLSLTKPRIIALLLLVTAATLAIAARRPPPLGLAIATLAGGALMSGAANALNCYLDRDIDRLMSRTRNRPLVAGRLAPRKALVFGLTLMVAAWVVFALWVNVLSGALAFAGLLLYVLVYTPAKRRWPLSVVLGAIAGAAPPLVAWAAANGSLDLNGLTLFAIMSVWQIPHTLALSIMLRNDYARAGVPVSPVAHGVPATRMEILVYSVLLCGTALVPGILGYSGLLYTSGALILSVRFIALAAAGLHPGALRSEIQLYKYSLLYLALLFTLMAVDRILLVAPPV